ncbi:hypothetical protein HPB50_025537 [Hyalomma asiaticum]|uniref:Uncharacterized protein n=1 Tax=Hyalomma asiaticum TaxID=266040 RepID=A0ACB7RR03_HYAAI|nr:hypothetical protein HPB50_025537 [Hyalomma asiaticum]
MSIRRLTHGSGQYGIKGQVLNVPINVQNTVQCVPRNVPDDAAFDVHLKRRLVNKRHVHEWLKHLERSPLYKYLNIKIDWSRLVHFDDDFYRCTSGASPHHPHSLRGYAVIFFLYLARSFQALKEFDLNLAMDERWGAV